MPEEVDPSTGIPWIVDDNGGLVGPVTGNGGGSSGGSSGVPSDGGLPSSGNPDHSLPNEPPPIKIPDVKPPSDAQVIERDAQGRDITSQDKAGEKYYLPGSLMYELGFRTESEYVNSQHYAGDNDAPMGIHGGNRTNNGDIIQLDIYGNPVARWSQAQVGRGNTNILPGLYKVAFTDSDGNVVHLTQKQADKLSNAQSDSDRLSVAKALNLVPQDTTLKEFTASQITQQRAVNAQAFIAQQAIKSQDDALKALAKYKTADGYSLSQAIADGVPLTTIKAAKFDDTAINSSMEDAKYIKASPEQKFAILQQGGHIPQDAKFLSQNPDGSISYTVPTPDIVTGRDILRNGSTVENPQGASSRMTSQVPRTLAEIQQAQIDSFREGLSFIPILGTAALIATKASGKDIAVSAALDAAMFIPIGEALKFAKVAAGGVGEALKISEGSVKAIDEVGSLAKMEQSQARAALVRIMSEKKGVETALEEAKSSLSDMEGQLPILQKAEAENRGTLAIDELRAKMQSTRQTIVQLENISPRVPGNTDIIKQFDTYVKAGNEYVDNLAKIKQVEKFSSKLAESDPMKIASKYQLEELATNTPKLKNEALRTAENFSATFRDAALYGEDIPKTAESVSEGRATLTKDIVNHPSGVRIEAGVGTTQSGALETVYKDAAQQHVRGLEDMVNKVFDPLPVTNKQLAKEAAKATQLQAKLNGLRAIDNPTEAQAAERLAMEAKTPELKSRYRLILMNKGADINTARLQAIDKLSKTQELLQKTTAAHLKGEPVAISTQAIADARAKLPVQQAKVAQLNKDMSKIIKYMEDEFGEPIQRSSGRGGIAIAPSRPGSGIPGLKSPPMLTGGGRMTPTLGQELLPLGAKIIYHGIDGDIQWTVPLPQPMNNGTFKMAIEAPARPATSPKRTIPLPAWWPKPAPKPIPSPSPSPSQPTPAPSPVTPTQPGHLPTKAPGQEPEPVTVPMPRPAPGTKPGAVPIPFRPKPVFVPAPALAPKVKTGAIVQSGTQTRELTSTEAQAIRATIAKLQTNIRNGMSPYEAIQEVNRTSAFARINVQSQNKQAENTATNLQQKAQSATKTGTSSKVSTQTSTSTNTQIKTSVVPATGSQTEQKTKTQPQTKTMTQTKVKTLAKQITIKTKLPLPSDKVKKGDKWQPSEKDIASAFALKAGFGWWLKFKNGAVKFYRKKPDGVQEVEPGKGSGYRSVQTVQGRPADDVMEIGFEHVHLISPSRVPGRVGAVTYVRKPTQKKGEAPLRTMPPHSTKRGSGTTRRSDR